METRLLLLRHGEAETPDRFHGAESDIGLGPRGRQQAIVLARHLAGLRPAAVCCSPMRRARETAGPIAEASGVPLEVVEALHERRMGRLSGRLKSEAWDHYADEKGRWMAGDLDYRRDGSESFAEVRDRALPTLRALADRPAGRTIVLVAHGVLIRVVLASLVDDLAPADFDRIGIENGAINDLRWGGGRWRAAALNERPEGMP